jgi:hypothetical protein
VRLIDIAPTLAEIASLDRSDPFVASLTGISLLRHLGPEPPKEPLPVIVESSRWGPKRAAVSVGGRKAISPMTYRWWFRQPGREGSWTKPWVKRRELYDIDADPIETRQLVADPEDPALNQLLEWRERTWRGVHLAMRLDPEWEGELRLDPAASWADEPQLEDQSRLYPLERDAGRIALSGLPSRILSLLLPVDLDQAGPLEIRSISGDLSVFDGQRWLAVPEGGSVTVDLSGLSGDASAPPAIPEGSSVVLRARSVARSEPMVLDEETRDRLEELGYGR